MKYSFEIKKEIYEKHCEGYGADTLSKEYGLSSSNIRYFCSLIDRHGLDVIKQKYRYYSPKFKLAAIRRVLVDGETVNAVALDIGLTKRCILDQWIKSYKENGYNVVTKKKD